MDEQDWAQVVAAATRAPSIHNTQPWRFTAAPDRLDVFLDPERALPVLDPTARQQVISCGSAVEFAVVALAAAGLAAEVDLLPDDGDPDHLATIRVTGPRDARRRGPRAGRGDRPPAHRAGRVPAAGACPTELVDRLQREAAPFGTWFKPITRSEEEVATVFLISRAEEMEQGDPAYLAELQRWVRTDPGAVDGVPVEAVPERRPARPPVELADPRLRRRPAREQRPVPAPPATRTRRRRTSSGRPSSSWAPTATTGAPGCWPAGPWAGCCCCATAAGRGGLAAHPGPRLAGDPHPDAVAAVPGRVPADAAADGISAGDARPAVSGRRPVGDVLRFEPAPAEPARISRRAPAGGPGIVGRRRRRLDGVRRRRAVRPAGRRPRGPRRARGRARPAPRAAASRSARRSGRRPAAGRRAATARRRRGPGRSGRT